MDTDDDGRTTDADLLDHVRHGDVEAYGELFVRHGEVARRVAVRAVGPSDADEVVAEVFAAVLARVLDGGGPAVSFRAYLLTSVRHEASRRRKQRRRCELVADTDGVAGVEPPPSEVVTVDGLHEAYTSLPDRWRHVLWALEVEGQTPREVAGQLGLTPNAVSALGYRARVGLREAYAARAEAA